MAHCVEDFVACPHLQGALNELWEIQDPATKIAQGETGCVEFLMSDVNTNGVLQSQVNPEPNKKRTVDLRFQKRLLTSELASSANSACTSDNKIGEEVATYDAPEQVTHYDFSWNYSDLADRCEKDEMYWAKTLMNVFNTIVRGIEAKSLADIAAGLVGGFGPNEPNVTSDIKTVTTYDHDGRRQNGDFLHQIWYAGVNAGFENNVYVLGWGELLRTMKLLKATGVANNGINLADLQTETGVVLVPTKGIFSATQSEGFYMLQPGALQLLTYNEVGINGISPKDGTYSEGVLVHPKYGIKADYFVHIFCRKVSLFLTVHHKVVGLPEMFCYGDDLYGTRGVMEGVVTNPAICNPCE